MTIYYEQEDSGKFGTEAIALAVERGNRMITVYQLGMFEITGGGVNARVRWVGGAGRKCASIVRLFQLSHH